MLLHTIGKLGEVSKGPDPFTDKYIFPGYHLPSLSQMTAASEKARLIASDVENLRLHYAYTLRHWLKRATARRAEIEAMYDARFFRMEAQQVAREHQQNARQISEKANGKAQYSVQQQGSVPRLVLRPRQLRDELLGPVSAVRLH